VQIHVLPEEAQKSPDSDAATTGALTNPQVKIGGEVLGWKGSLTAGQYLTVWPGEPPVVRGPDAAASMDAPEDGVEAAPPPAPQLELKPGTYSATFTAETTGTLPYRVRLIFATPEKHLLQSR
jgi:hypothetical protein